MNHSAADGSRLMSWPLPAKGTGVLLVLGLLLWPAPFWGTTHLPGARHVLEGTRFVGPTGELKKSVDHEDELSFRDGYFRSSACEEWGFGPSSYSAWREGNAVVFEAELQSPENGTMAWQGRIVDDVLTARYRWTKERWYWTIRRDYWFEGRRRAGPDPSP